MLLPLKLLLRTMLKRLLHGLLSSICKLETFNWGLLNDFMHFPC